MICFCLFQEQGECYSCLEAIVSRPWPGKEKVKLRMPLVRNPRAHATSVLALRDRSCQRYEATVQLQSYSVEPEPQRRKLPAVRSHRATPILVALLSAGSGPQEPLSDPLDATINDFLMWCGQRAVQVGQKGLPVSCIFRRSPGVAVALQSLELQFRVQRSPRPSSAGSTTCTQDFFALPVTSFEVSTRWMSARCSASASSRLNRWRTPSSPRQRSQALALHLDHPGY